MKKLTCSIVVAGTLLSACSGSTPSSPSASTPVSIGSVVITPSKNVAAGEGVEFTFEVTLSTNAATTWLIDFGDRSNTATAIIGASTRVTASHVYRAAGSYKVTAYVSVGTVNVATGTLDVNVS